MAANLLPLIAIAGAAFFLMKKKGEPGTGGNGTGGNGAGGGTPGKDSSTIKTPGLYDMKVGETVTIVPPSGYFVWAPNTYVDDVNVSNDSTESFIMVENEHHSPPLSDELGSITFRPTKKGVFRLELHDWDGTMTGSDFDTDEIEYVFSVS